MDSDSSSDSDDDFLTHKSKGNTVDREALIRKKLLQNFYGGKEGSSNNADGGGGVSGDNLDNNNQDQEQAPRSFGRGNSVDATDVDSPYFDAAAHTAHHVVNSSLHTLLEMDEQLTHQVRTLDSSTQNMVYENYSKFIDATEAVKSVGINVEANQQGLERLQKGMQVINEQSRLVEEDLGSLRDAVAEKIRVKRLLTRLELLLKLPETVKEHIATGKYRTAASNFCSATTILSKHSAGFESLQKIEIECNAIVADMLKDLKRKILYWSGRNSLSSSMPNYNSDDDDSDDEAARNNNDNDDDNDDAPDPPQSISEIFECAGTLAMIVKEKPADFDPGVTFENCKEMSMTASTRLLDRLFDQHHLELQEAAFSVGEHHHHHHPSDGGGGAFDGDHSLRTQQQQQQAQKGSHLIPTMVIDSILEAATLYGMTFLEHATEPQPSDDRDHLVEFVTEAFGSFLAHVRMVLLEQSAQATQRAQEATGQEEAEADGEEVYEDISGAMSILLHSVHELASGLSLPEVGINPDLASSLVDQASELTEAMVRRRVEQKFCDLRLRIVHDCLAPFAKRVASDDGKPDSSSSDNAPNNKRARVLQLVQVAVSDCLQLLDDTVRSIVSGRDVFGSSAASIDLPILKKSIQGSTGRFASWLAATLEVLAGCESSDPKVSFQASRDRDLTEDEQHQSERDAVRRSTSSDRDEMSELSGQDDLLTEKVEAAIWDLIGEIDGKGQGIASYDFIVAICEMCRGCERAFVDNMTQSIESNVGGGKKAKSSGLFPMDESKKGPVLSDHERKTTERFRLSTSRILCLYAANRGFEAANQLCSGLLSFASAESDDFPESPREATSRVLGIAKLAALDCAELFNENKRGGPVPEFSGGSSVTPSLGMGMNSSPLKGLQLDVERMFKEQVTIYPHPATTIDFSRSAVLFLFFKVAFKALAEHTRQCSFSVNGYNQMLVDTEFLREMIPHYINKNYQVDGNAACSSLSTLLGEVMNGAGERCNDEDCVGNEDLSRTANSVLRKYMKTSVTSTSSFVILED